MFSKQDKEGKRTQNKFTLKLPNSVLKKCSSYRCCLDYFMVDRCTEELLQQHRSCTKAQKISKLSSNYPNDDCLYHHLDYNNQTNNCLESSKDMRMINAAWRLWYQKYFNLPKQNSNDGLSFPKNFIPKRFKRRVSFSETVDEMIIPPKRNMLLSDESEYDENDMEDDPGFIDNLGSVCFNILITIGSFLTPYHNKRLKSWLY